MVLEHGTALIERRNARKNMIITTLGVVAAIFTFLTAALGILSSSLSGDVGSLNTQVGKLTQKNDQLQAQLTQANASLDDRSDQIEELKKVVADLRGQLPPSAQTADKDAKVRSTGTIVLATDGDKLDLNSTLPNFKPKSQWVFSDILSYDRGTFSTYGMSVVTLPSGVASFGSCSTVTGWTKTNELEASSLAQQNVCIRLASGRFASIVASTYDEDRATLAITVWEDKG